MLPCNQVKHKSGFRRCFRLNEVQATVKAGEVFCRVLSQIDLPSVAGLTPVQLDGLRFVATHPHSRVKDLAQGLRISHPAATKLVDRLAARGVLSRKAGTVDRREVGLELTATGETALSASRRSQREKIGDILGRMGPADRLALRNGLEAFVRAALRTAADIEAVCGHCGSEHAADCPLGLLYRELTGRLTPPV